MRLNEIHQGLRKSARKSVVEGIGKGIEDGLRAALKSIYGHNGRPAGFVRPKLHRIRDASSVEHGNRALGARTADSGTPWKPRHRKFFRMSNDGGSQSMNRY